MIPISQRHRAGLQFLGSLQHFSSSHIRDIAREQFAASEKGREFARSRGQAGTARPVENARGKPARRRWIALPTSTRGFISATWPKRISCERFRPWRKNARNALRSSAREPEYQGGSLELDDSVPIPKYYEGVEWHLEPGGWDGYDLATPMFMAGVAPHVFSRGGYAAVEVDQDIRRQRVDVVSLLPKDHYDRIYEPGCGGLGALAACSKVYPDAELTGSDISTALLQGGHKAARTMGIPIHLKQRDARDTGEPDESYDAVLMYALLHEMPVKVSIDTIREAYRILKPGGDHRDQRPAAIQPRGRVSRPRSWTGKANIAGNRSSARPARWTGRRCSKKSASRCSKRAPWIQGATPGSTSRPSLERDAAPG